MRTKAAPRFRELPLSEHRVRDDGLLQIEKPRKTAKEKPAALCSFLLDGEGNQLPCSTPLGPHRSFPDNQIFSQPDLASARVFHASEGAPSQISKLPVWIVDALSRLVDSSPSYGLNHAGVSLIDARRFRVWPLQRKHPALGVPETCRVDIALDGRFETDCRQGRLFSVGRVGLMQKKRDELYETSRWRRQLGEARAAEGLRLRRDRVYRDRLSDRSVLARGLANTRRTVSSPSTRRSIQAIR